MRAAIAALAVVLAASVAHARPTKEHPLEDLANVVPAADEAALESELHDLRAAGVDMAVIVTSTLRGVGQSIQSYTHDRAMAWASGTTPAAVLVLVIKEHKSRLEVSDSLRATFPDARAQSILDNIKGYLRSTDYTGAIRAVIAEVKAGADGVAPDLESPHPQVPDPSDTASPPSEPAVAPPPPSRYEQPREPRERTPLLVAIFGGGALLLAAYLWARSRIASRATLTANGVITSDRSIVAETLWCMCLIIGGVLYIAAIVALSSSRSSGSSWSSSSSSWGSSSGGSSSSGGGWGGGGASSGW